MEVSDVGFRYPDFTGPGSNPASLPCHRVLQCVPAGAMVGTGGGHGGAYLEWVGYIPGGDIPHTGDVWATDWL